MRAEFRDRWTSAMLRPRGHQRRNFGLARYAMSTALSLCDLDDGHRLIERNLRPSDVISRDRSATQAWARAIFSVGSYTGVRWWSYHDARWGSIGIWDIYPGIVIEVDVEPLTLDHPALADAARILSVEIAGARTAP